MPPLPTPLAIETDAISVRRGAARALEAVSLAVPQGAIFGLLGPAGAGKTTALQVIAGRLRPSAGGGRVLGYDLLRERAAYLPRIGWVIERPIFHPLMTVRGNLRLRSYPGRATRRARIDEALRRVGLAELQYRRVHTLTPGARMRMALALALLGGPELLLLDEPTLGLGPHEAEGLYELLRSLHAGGLTILLASPSRQELERLCTHAAVLSAGHLLTQGPVSALRAGRQTLLVEAEPRPIVAVVLERMGLQLAPAGPDRFHVDAPPEVAPRLVSALVNAGAHVRQVRPLPAALAGGPPLAGTDG